MGRALDLARWILLPLSLLTATGVTFWVLLGLGGLGRSGATLFNWHPVLMSISALVLLPQGVLRWSASAKVSGALRQHTKWMHIILVGTAFVAINVAVGIAYASHLQQTLASFYSLHSWVGLGALVLLKSNVMGGLLAALLPRWRVAEFSGEMHRRVGFAAVFSVFVATVTGLSELQGFVVQRGGNAFAAAAVIGGGLGVLAMLVGVLMWVLVDSEFDAGPDGVADGKEVDLDAAFSEKLGVVGGGV